MARQVSGPRVLDGTRYQLFSIHRRKKDATWVARRVRHQGRKARVLKIKAGWGVFRGPFR